MLSLARRWLFIHIPKTGGNSLQSIIAAQSEDQLVSGGLRDGVDRFEVTGPMTKHKHFTLQNYHDQLSAEAFDSLFKFCVVRDPWERAISWYFTPIRWVERGFKAVWSVEEFKSALPQLPGMVDMLSIGGEYRPLDMTLRFENFEQDASALLSRLGVSHSALPRRNQGLRTGDWRRYYVEYPELSALVAKTYGADAEAFGYGPPVRV